MKLTINDIAKLCDVSTGTVNRVLHDKPDVSKKTREKVLKVISEVGYEPSYHARSLATGKTNTIGMIVPNMENEFFSMLYTEIEKTFWEKGYLMNLVLSNDDPEKEQKYISSFINRQVDGLIIFPVNKDSSQIKRAIQQGVHTVMILNDLPDISANIVKINEYTAITQTVQYLIDNGHKRIAYIDGYRHYSEKYNDYINDERHRAFRDTMVKNHIMYSDDLYIEFKPEYYTENEFSVLNKFVNTDESPTAVVCFHDQIAIWAMRGLKKLGVKIPQDMSITGFDDINELQYVNPMLTTNRIPSKEIAHQALSMLINDINENKSGSKEVMLHSALVVRESCLTLNN